MYKFRPISERVSKLRDRIRDRQIIADAEIPLLLTEAYKLKPHMLPELKHAWALKYVCERVTPYVDDEALFTGGLGKNFCSTCQPAEWKGIGWIPQEIRKGNFELREDGLLHNGKSDQVQVAISPEDYEALLSIEEFWEENRFANIAASWAPEGFEAFSALGASIYREGDKLIEAPAGHIIPGHEKIINTGFKAIKEQAQSFLNEKHGRIFGKDMGRYIFYQSAVWACEGATALYKRYASACRKKADEVRDETRKAELISQADSIEHISEYPARNYFEALQMVVLYQAFLNLESGHPGLALGRFDQYAWPFLKKDLEEGRLSLDSAQEITDEFFLKLNCFYKGGHGPTAQITGIGNTWQHTTIGGVRPEDGEDASNPLTYMVLETVGRLKLHDPTISLRINKNTPEMLWDCAIETSKLVGGLPLYQNDEIIIPAARRELGYSLYDARNIGFIGCQEIVGSGNDYPACTGASCNHEKVHWGVVLAMALNNGINPFNGKDCGIHRGCLYDMKSIDEVKDAIAEIGESLINWVATMNNYVDYIYSQYCAHAGLSISIEGCMEKGLDCSKGGAKYNSVGSCACGLATLADSISAIEYACFNEKICSLRELYDAVMANWEGYESLRAKIIKDAPHFGNNDEAADRNMAWITGLYYDLVSKCSIGRTDIYRAGMFSAADHIIQGYHTWATPDGRKTGDPIADAASPAQGRDKNGPTGVLASACSYDNSRFMNNLALNLRFTPTALSTDSDKAKLRDMIKAYFSGGGMEVQFNIVDCATLSDARENPSEYKNLVVRVAGYSAYFVEMTRDMQNDIIARNENTL
ncbi:MAG: hypothetical protein MJ067_01410 [Oscillospiraceae bacterium]|nr:hypothetical protein [Oscillospiraceae bacterium]